MAHSQADAGEGSCLRRRLPRAQAFERFDLTYQLEVRDEFTLLTIVLIDWPIT
jgi:hypothetical protein